MLNDKIHAALAADVFLTLGSRKFEGVKAEYGTDKITIEVGHSLYIRGKLEAWLTNAIDNTLLLDKKVVQHSREVLVRTLPSLTVEEIDTAIAADLEHKKTVEEIVDGWLVKYPSGIGG